MGAPRRLQRSRGHEFAVHGYANSKGYHICRPCVQIRRKGRERQVRVGTRMAKLLRQGLLIDTKEPGVKLWQRWVFQFFEETA